MACQSRGNSSKTT